MFYFSLSFFLGFGGCQLDGVVVTSRGRLSFGEKGVSRDQVHQLGASALEQGSGNSEFLQCLFV
jgi:hypothetical protein